MTLIHEQPYLNAAGLANDDTVPVTDADGTPAHTLAHTTIADLIALARAIKLDDFAAPDDNTDLDASTASHGLMPKFPGGTTAFLRADGTFATPPGSSSAIVAALRGSGSQALNIGTYTKVPLNSELLDPSGIVSISSSVFTLGAGSYLIIGLASVSLQDSSGVVAMNVTARIRNTADSTTVAESPVEELTGYTVDSGSSVITRPVTVVGATTIAGSKTFELQVLADGTASSAQTNAETRIIILQVA